MSTSSLNSNKSNNLRIQTLKRVLLNRQRCWSGQSQNQSAAKSPIVNRKSQKHRFISRLKSVASAPSLNVAGSLLNTRRRNTSRARAAYIGPSVSSPNRSSVAVQDTNSQSETTSLVSPHKSPSTSNQRKNVLGPSSQSQVIPNKKKKSLASYLNISRSFSGRPPASKHANSLAAAVLDTMAEDQVPLHLNGPVTNGLHPVASSPTIFAVGDSLDSDSNYDTDNRNTTDMADNEPDELYELSSCLQQTAGASADWLSPLDQSQSRSPSVRSLESSVSVSGSQRSTLENKVLSAGRTIRNFLSPSYRSRNEEMRQIFTELDYDDKFVIDYSCAYQREILVHGRMFCTQRHLCFHANIFKWETREILPWKHITALVKEKTAVVIPNAIQLTSVDGQKHFFTSFARRDRCYMMMFKLWQSALLDETVGVSELWSWAQHGYDKTDLSDADGDDLDLESDQSTKAGNNSTLKPNQTDTGSPEDAELLSPGPVPDTVNGVASAQSQLHMVSCSAPTFSQLLQSDPHSTVCAANQPINDKETNPPINDKENNGPLCSGASASANTASVSPNTHKRKAPDVPRRVGDGDSKRQSHHHNHHKTRTRHAHHNDQTSTGSESLSASVVVPGECECECKEHTGTQLLHAEYPVSVDELFVLLFTDNQFLRSFVSDKAKCSQLVFGEWKALPNTLNRQRVYKYTMALSGAVGPKSVNVTETQTLCERQVASGACTSCFMIGSECYNGGVPYADSFLVLTNYCIRRISANRASIRVMGNVKFTKSVWGFVKGLIERPAISGLQEYFRKLDSALVQECANLGLGTEHPVHGHALDCTQDTPSLSALNTSAVSANALLNASVLSLSPTNNQSTHTALGNTSNQSVTDHQGVTVGRSTVEALNTQVHWLLPLCVVGLLLLLVLNVCLCWRVLSTEQYVNQILQSINTHNEQSIYAPLDEVLTQKEPVSSAELQGVASARLQASYRTLHIMSEQLNTLLQQIDTLKRTIAHSEHNEL